MKVRGCEEKPGESRPPPNAVKPNCGRHQDVDQAPERSPPVVRPSDTSHVQPHNTFSKNRRPNNERFEGRGITV